MAIPTRLIIIITRRSSVITYAMRADVPVGQEAFYKPSAPAVSPVGNVSDPDLPGLTEGTIAQTITDLDLPQNPGETGAQYRARAQAALVAQQLGFQQRVSAAAPQAFFGAYYNGTAWLTSGA